MNKAFAVAAAAILGGSYLASAQAPAQPAAPQQPMGFFITSVGTGTGANLGGLAGADKHCQTLAAAAGGGNRTWRAYLSQTASGSTPAVNARDRIGAGPWHNAKGDLIAENVDGLHGEGNGITKQTALTESGTVGDGRGDTPNQHDILTGSDSHGRALPGVPNTTTCNNWTSNAEGVSAGAGQPAAPRAQIGHHDRSGGGNSSWNSAHPTRGCSQPNLVATGGAGLFYCFAEK
jgi:hypothetical protein